ncbi:MAG TPA: hypothetical protein VE913_02440 [Longimicrobium sp.]|nr:hypothetical protein [Longimicrobium sp.]
MHPQKIVWMASVALLTSGCAAFTGRPANMPQSMAGTVAHGEMVAVPYGSVDDWNIIVSPMRMGAEEARSENDNRLLALRVFATVRSDTQWQVTAQYRFGYALTNADVFWVEGSANYLIVRR